MRKIVTVLLAVIGFSANAQEAFSGKGDTKVQVGANFQSGAQGIVASYDYGVGKNISFGLQSVVLLSTSKFYNTDLFSNDFGQEVSPKFMDKVDLNARFNANLSDVIGIKELDVYPGLHLGLRNFGFHTGARYFFTDGFGVFTEVAIPLAKYGNDTTYNKIYNNQVTFSLGASFNL